MTSSRFDGADEASITTGEGVWTSHDLSLGSCFLSFLINSLTRHSAGLRRYHGGGSDTVTHVADLPVMNRRPDVRIAIYGGSFNPPHVAHGMVASWLLWTKQVDQVWLVPVFQHALEGQQTKRLADFSERVRWCEAVAADVDSRIHVCEVAADLPVRSYTLDTLKHLSTIHPEHTFRLVIGADVFDQTDRWRDWPGIQKHFAPIIVGRAGYASPEGVPVFPEVSSTEIRDRIAAGESVDEMVTGRVAQALRGTSMWWTLRWNRRRKYREIAVRFQTLLPILVGILCLISGWAAARNPHMVEFDSEEAVNAAQAIALLAGHGGMEFMRLQYATFCGGCTVNAVLGSVVFSAIGPSWMAWKMVAVLTFAGFAGVAVAILRRCHGLYAATAFSLLLLAPWKTWLSLSLVALGNHQEAGLFGAVGLLAVALSRSVRSTLVAGAVLGFSLFVGWSAAPAAAAGCASLLLRKSFRRLSVLVGGILLGLAPLLALRAYIGKNHPIREIYGRTAFVPGVEHVQDKLSHLIEVGLPAALFGWPSPFGRWVGVLCLVTIVICAVLAWRRRSNVGTLAVLGVLAWVCAYALVGFRLEKVDWSYLGTPIGLRYAAPLFPMVALLLASEVGHLWASKRFMLASMIIAPSLVSGLYARQLSVDLDGSSVGQSALYPADPDLEREIFSERLYLNEIVDCDSDSPHHRGLHAWALAWRGVHDALDNHPKMFHRPAELQPPTNFSEEMWWRGLGSTLSAQSSPNPTSSVWHVGRLESWIVDAPPEFRQASRREFWWTWLQMYSGSSLADAPGSDTPALQWAQGRMVGRASAAWFYPSAKELQSGVLDSVGEGSSSSDHWLEGFGFGVAEHWGVEGETFTLVENIEPLGRGYRAGVALRWNQQ
jgi:nicotinate-nucleotide adenylyltransferase